MATSILTNYAFHKKTGAAKRLSRAVLALANAGINVDFVNIVPPDIKNANIRFHSIKPLRSMQQKVPDHNDHFSWIYYMLRAAILCIKIARAQKTNGIMAFTLGGALPLLPTIFLTGKPMVLILRSDEVEELRIKRTSLLWRTLFSFLAKRSIKTATHIISVSQTLIDTINNRYNINISEKSSVLFNNLSSTPPDKNKCKTKTQKLVGNSNCFIFSMTAYFRKLKNADILIQAMAQLKNTRAYLLLIGNGPDTPNLKQMALDLKVDSRILFTSWRDDAFDLVAGSDIFVLPSMTEGISNSVMEALSAKTPCLISRIPAHEEIAADDDMLFNPHNATELADKMRNLINNSELLEKLSRICTETAKKFDFDWEAKLVDIIKNNIS
ncbi:glycosyltransferase [Verrucomicrobiota bacterium]